MIKRLLAALSVMCLATAPLYAQESRAQLRTEILSQLPTQNVGAITPPVLRGVLNDIVNSAVNVVDGNIFNVDQYNPFHDFAHDDAPAINAALGAAQQSGGGRVLLNASQPYWAQTAITVPSGVTLGCAAPPEKQPENTNHTNLGCAIYLAPNNTLIVNGAIRNSRVYQDNIHFAGNPSTAHALSAITANFSSTGTGIKMNAHDAIVEDVAIAGFNLGIEDNSLNRGSIRHVLIEATSCIKYDVVGDYSKGLDIECWPYYSTNRSGNVTEYTANISNVADNGSGAWRVTLSAPPPEALVTGDTIFIGGNGALQIPQGAQGKHTITTVDSTHFDLTGSHTAPSVTGTTTTGSPYVTGLSTLADLWPGQTFTGTCFTGTRTAKMMLQNSALVADAAATSSGSCTLTFANQAFAANGTPQAIYSARNDWNGVGIEFAGGTVSGGLFNNIYVWCHQVAFQFDTNTITATLDTVSIDCSPSKLISNRIGFWFQPGTQWNRVSGNSQTSGGTMVWNQSGHSSLSQANLVKLGRAGAWAWGSIENDSGSLIVSGTIDPDNSAAAGQYDGDIFNLTGENLVLSDGSAFPNSRFISSVGGVSNQVGTSGLATDSSFIGTEQFLYPPGTIQLGAGGGNGGKLLLNGSTSGSAVIQATSVGALTLANNAPGQAMVLNDAGNGTMLSVVGAGGPTANHVQLNSAQTGNPPIVVAGGTDTDVDLELLPQGAGNVRVGNSGSFAANGSVATVLGNVGPVGSHTAVQKWFTIKDSGGNVLYIPAF